MSLWDKPLLFLQICTEKPSFKLSPVGSQSFTRVNVRCGVEVLSSSKYYETWLLVGDNHLGDPKHHHCPWSE